MAHIQTVAVIGAGISGVCSAAHLLRQKLDVTLFERSAIAGGVWHFDERSASDPNYPNELPSRGDYERVLFQDQDVYPSPAATPPRHLGEDDQPKSVATTSNILTPLVYAPPGPCYAGLKNNVSLSAMQTSLGPWPPGLEEFVSQSHLEEYIQGIARQHGVNDISRYNTRVEAVTKIGDKWKVLTTSLKIDSSTGLPRLLRNVAFFDAIVVASGHYHMPRVPDIPGLVDWKRRFPERIMHSKGYRDALKFTQKNVLIVGAGVSSIDIAKEIASVGGKVYQSSRGGTFDLPATSLPASGSRVGGLQRLELDEQNSSTGNDDTQPIPGHIILQDGTKLKDIHYIILATGYITSYPFLPQLHSDVLSCHEVEPHLLVTKEGDMVHHLHKEIFYIKDPSLAFVGVPYHVSTFSLFDFQAQVIARVFGGKASLPPQGEMRAQYLVHLNKTGAGREFHSLRATGAELEYVADLVQWMNEDLQEGVEPMDGHTPTFLTAHRIQREALSQRFGGQVEDWVPRLLLQ